jgi:hypothetical protein
LRADPDVPPPVSKAKKLSSAQAPYDSTPARTKLSKKKKKKKKNQISYLPLQTLKFFQYQCLSGLRSWQPAA